MSASSGTSLADAYRAGGDLRADEQLARVPHGDLVAHGTHVDVGQPPLAAVVAELVVRWRIQAVALLSLAGEACASCWGFGPRYEARPESPGRFGRGDASCVASAEPTAVHAADELALLTQAPSPAPASG